MPINVGDKVGYAKPFLRSIHASKTDPLWFERGTVEVIKDYPGAKRVCHVRGFATENDDGMAHVLESNIAVVGSFRHAEAEK